VDLFDRDKDWDRPLLERFAPGAPITSTPMFKEMLKSEVVTALVQKMVASENLSEQASQQRILLGVKEQPFNFQAAVSFKNQNAHHSTCIEAKKESSIGVGFVDESLYEKLDPLCTISWHDTLLSISEDYEQTGNGYLEVVWNKERTQVKGLHHIPSQTVRIVIEDASYHRHFMVSGEDGMFPTLMATFGDLLFFNNRVKGVNDTPNQPAGAPQDVAAVHFQMGYSIGFGTPSERSEIIHFRRPSSLSRWYGFPDWLACVASIELLQCVVQDRYDFFLNRGVPEFALFLLGKQLAPNDWAAMKAAFQSIVGRGNQHKSLLFNIADPEMKIQLEKLAVEVGHSVSPFTEMANTLDLAIVTAHRTPPLLAGIQTPGKLGATNELPNALMAFQVLVVGPTQRVFMTTLAATLGDSTLTPGLGLSRDSFKLKTIVEEIPLGLGQQQPGAAPAPGDAAKGIQAMGTIGRMRTPMMSSGPRDLAAGVKT
jgi:capsid portal protein